MQMKSNFFEEQDWQMKTSQKLRKLAVWLKIGLLSVRRAECKCLMTSHVNSYGPVLGSYDDEHILSIMIRHARLEKN